MTFITRTNQLITFILSVNFFQSAHFQSVPKPIQVKVLQLRNDDTAQFSQPFYNYTNKVDRLCHDSFYRILINDIKESNIGFDVCIFGSVHPYLLNEFQTHPYAQLNIFGEDDFSSFVLTQMYKHFEVKPNLWYPGINNKNISLLTTEDMEDDILKLGFIALGPGRFGIVLAIVGKHLEEIVFVDTNKIYTLKPVKDYDIAEYNKIVTENQDRQIHNNHDLESNEWIIGESLFEMQQVDILTDVHTVRVISPTVICNNQRFYNLQTTESKAGNFKNFAPKACTINLYDEFKLDTESFSIKTPDLKYIENDDSFNKSSIFKRKGKMNKDKLGEKENMTYQINQKETIFIDFDKEWGQMATAFTYGDSQYTILPLMDDKAFLILEDQLPDDDLSSFGNNIILPPHVIVITKSHINSKVQSDLTSNLENDYDNSINVQSNKKGTNPDFKLNTNTEIISGIKNRLNAITGPYIIETIFYVTPSHLTIPKDYLNYLAGMIDNLLIDPTVRVPLRFKLIDIKYYPEYLIVPDDLEKTQQNLKEYINFNASVDLYVLISSLIVTDNKYVGRATTHGICQGDDSIIVAHDTGFSTVTTILHEIGHLFGAEHDMAFEECSRPETRGIMYYGFNIHEDKIMSDCTIKEIQKTLRSGSGDCLLRNSETNKNLLSKKYPWNDINDWLCKRFGPDFVVNYQQSHCGQLICSHKGSHRYRWSSDAYAFDNTPCNITSSGEIDYISDRKGSNLHYCKRGKCVKNLSSLIAVNKVIDIHKNNWSRYLKPKSEIKTDWGPWITWSVCKGFCGLGYRERTRECKRGDREDDICLGEYQQTQLCQIKKRYYDCKASLKSVYMANDRICQKYVEGARFFPNKRFNQYFGNYSSCNLLCKKRRNFIKTNNYVIDGTPYDSDHLCLGGVLI